MRNQLRMASRGRRVRLASGDALSAAEGFVDGQMYVDALTDASIARARSLFEKQIEGILEAVNQASGDYERLRELLIERYADLRPDELAEVIEGGLVLANLAGRLAVKEDT